MKQLSTGQAAHLIGRTEPRLADLVRKGKINPEPELFAGRRLWQAEHVRQAAEQLGLLSDSVQEFLAEYHQADDAGTGEEEERSHG